MAGHGNHDYTIAVPRACTTCAYCNDVLLGKSVGDKMAHGCGFSFSCPFILVSFILFASLSHSPYILDECRLYMDTESVALGSIALRRSYALTGDQVFYSEHLLTLGY